jgi:hypothetical protein
MEALTQRLKSARESNTSDQAAVGTVSDLCRNLRCQVTGLRVLGHPCSRQAQAAQLLGAFQCALDRDSTKKRHRPVLDKPMQVPRVSSAADPLKLHITYVSTQYSVQWV